MGALHTTLCRLVQVYEGLNVIGRVPYRINRRVHDVILEAWRNGGGIAELPSLKDHLLPSAFDPEAYSSAEEMQAARR